MRHLRMYEDKYNDMEEDEIFGIEENSDEYFLTQDSSSHWYIVPYNRRMEWNLWAELPDDDPNGWAVPAWAIRIGGCPSKVIFKTYRII